MECPNVLTWPYRSGGLSYDGFGEVWSIERRTFVRLPNEAKITFHKLEYPLADGGDKRATMKDIGRGGLLFQAEHMVDVGTLLQLDIDQKDMYKCKPGLPEIGGESLSEPLTFVAEVVRSVEVIPGEKYDIAVKFVEIFKDITKSRIRF